LYPKIDREQLSENSRSPQCSPGAEKRFLIQGNRAEFRILASDCPKKEKEKIFQTFHVREVRMYNAGL